MKTYKDLGKYFATVFSWTAFLTLIGIGGLLVYYVVATQIYAKRGETYEPPVALYTIISGSMERELMVYDVVVNFKVNDPHKIKTGDIITFTSVSSLNPGMTVTHRVVETIQTDQGIFYKTKGDANPTADASPVPFEKVKGRTVFKIPQLGRVQFLLASKGGWFFAILLPALGIIIYDVLKLLKLVGVNKKVEKINETNEIDKEKEIRENNRKKELKEKLSIDDNEEDIRNKVREKYGDVSDEQMEKLVKIIKEKKD